MLRRLFSVGSIIRVISYIIDLEMKEDFIKMKQSNKYYQATRTSKCFHHRATAIIKNKRITQSNKFIKPD